MSAKNFIQHLQGTPELQASLSGDGWSMTSIVAAGAAAGFDFTADEYRAAYREVAREELACVTGGLRDGGTCGPAWKGGTTQML
jgi:predicted ribosomally synthesized peptide with nif11-like leader